MAGIINGQYQCRNVAARQWQWRRMAADDEASGVAAWRDIQAKPSCAIIGGRGYDS